MKAQPKAGISKLLDKCITNATKNPYSTLAEEEVAQLSAAEVKLLENFIYTRCFTATRDKLHSNYFTVSDKTLTPKIKQDSNFIQSTAYNLELLYAFSNAAAVTLSNLKFDSTLNGYWQQGTSVIAGELLTNYHFLQQDHSFLYEHKTADKKDRLVNYSGFYSFTATGVELEIRTKTLYKTGGINRTKSSGIQTSSLSGNNQTVVHLEDVYEYKIITLSPVYSITFDGITKQYCRINGKVFWKCYPAE